MTRVRKMREADIAAVSAIRVRGWQTAYAGLVPGTYLDAMTVEADAVRRRQMFARPRPDSEDLVALGDGGPVGWVRFGPYRGAVPGAAGRDGEVYALYVAPELLGQGTGTSLLNEAHGHMKALGFDVSALWVLRDNLRARRFYERAGYRADGGAQDDVYDGITLTEVRYRRALA
ncbi:GNAT family N-acetyltransferase [Streptomyces sp. NPDC016845]|uniref:GNAT family N-acetyltransferase n=1 Tax=Streptomyces sp. NPDC016845 TaxID=3364972 RepID=UPI0037A31CF8